MKAGTNAQTGGAIPDGTGGGTMTGTIGAGTLTGTATGSWAQSTYSAIWMTRGNGNLSTHAMVSRPWKAEVASLAVIAAAVLLGAANLIDVYGSVSLWAIAAVPATILGCLIALAGTISALRLWWQILFLITAQCIIGPVVALNDTTMNHAIPTVNTLAQGFIDTFGSFKYLISINPPIGSSSGGLMALWTLCLWAGALGGIFAVLEHRMLNIISVVPVAAMLTACALLGTAAGYHRVLSGVAVALLLIIWLSWRWQLLELNRGISAIIIIALASAAAVAGCIYLPASRTILRDTYQPPISPYDYASPLSGMRAYIENHKNDTLLVATNLPAATPVKLAVMDSFDGNVWNLSDSRQASDSSDYRRVGAETGAAAKGTGFTATFTLKSGLADNWLPLAGAASTISFNNPQVSNELYYNTDTKSAIIPSGIPNALVYTEKGVLDPVPSQDQIAKANASPQSQPAAKDVPSAVTKLATAIAGGKTTGGEAALALAAELKASGWFSHGLNGDYPSLAGHGSYRINQLLSGTAMVGDSEQYASAMALMAREAGLPSRVVLGFLPKDKSGEISASRTTRQSDGVPTTTFTGNDVSAWVEIKLTGYGWVAFYPTPPETKIPDQNQNMTPPNPQTLIRQPPVPLTNPLRDTNQAQGQSSLAGQPADNGQNGRWWSTMALIATQVAIYGSPVWALLIVCMVILLIKAMQLARLRRRGSPQERVTAGWKSICALARDSGLPVSGTRREQARSIAERFDIEAPQLDALGREADYAAFSGMALKVDQAQAYWTAIDGLRAAILRSQPRLRRIMTRLSVSGIYHGRHLRNILLSITIRHPLAGRRPLRQERPEP